MNYFTRLEKERKLSFRVEILILGNNYLQMLQAMSLYSNQARGSASQKFAELLIEECTNYWMAGRQACEELSLTG